ETLRWTVVQQPGPETSGKSRRRGGKTPESPDFPDLRSVLVLQKSFECSECGKSFSCSSHFSKHRRTHTG
ncbi:ZN829 protein, partial [Hippolais icterina]|nr:ZN829 protein [Hippolais icterina]